MLYFGNFVEVENGRICYFFQVMKSAPLSLGALAAAALFLANTGNATVIYLDNFGGTVGTNIDGRTPDVTDTTGFTYVATNGGSPLVVDGGGRVVSINGEGAMNIALPTITSDQVITITLQLRPQQASVDNWIAVGLKADTTGNQLSNGTAWALLGGFPAEGAGSAQVFSGDATAGPLFSANPVASAGLSKVSTLTLVYNTTTGNLKVDLSSINGSATLFNGIISYGGTANTPAPLSAVQALGVQWFKQNTSNGGVADAGYVDSLKVDVRAVSSEKQ